MSEPTAGQDPPAGGGTAGSLPLTTQAGKSAAAAAALAARASAEKEGVETEEDQGNKGQEFPKSHVEPPTSTVSDADPAPNSQPAAPAAPAVQPPDKSSKPPAAADPPAANPTPGAIKRKALSGLMARLAKPKARRRSNGAAPVAASNAAPANPPASAKSVSVPDNSASGADAAAVGTPGGTPGDAGEVKRAADTTPPAKEASPPRTEAAAATSPPADKPADEDPPSISAPADNATEKLPDSKASTAPPAKGDASALPDPERTTPAAPALPVSGPRRRVPSKLAIAAAESEAEVAASRGRGRTRGGSRGGKGARSGTGKRGGSSGRGRGRGRPSAASLAQAKAESAPASTKAASEPDADDTSDKEDTEKVVSGPEQGTKAGRADDAKSRKSYVSTKTREVWSTEEHERFIEAVEKYGRKWKSVAEHVHTRTPVQIRSHAQKYYNKLSKEGCEADIPPPRRKRRPAAPSNSGNGQQPGAQGSEPPAEDTSPGMALSSDAETAGTRSGSGKAATSLEAPGGAAPVSRPSSTHRAEPGSQMKVEMEMTMPQHQGFGDGGGGGTASGTVADPSDPWQQGNARAENWDPSGKGSDVMQQRQQQMRMQQQGRQMGPSPGMSMGNQMGGFPQFDDHSQDNLMMQGGLPPGAGRDGGPYPMGDAMNSWGYAGMRQGMGGYGPGPGSGSGWGMDSGGMSDLGQVMDHPGMDLPPDMRQAGGSYMSHSGYRMGRGMSGEMAMGWGQSGRGIPPVGGSSYYGDFPSGMMQQQQYWRGGGPPGPSYGQTGMTQDDFPSIGPGGSFDGGDGGPRMRMPNAGMRMRGDVRSAQPIMDMEQQMYAQQGGFRQPNVGMAGNDGMMGGGFTQGQGSVMDNSRYMMNESPVMEEGSAYSGSPGMMPSQQGSSRNMYNMPGGSMGMSPYGMQQSDQPPSQQHWRGIPGDSSDAVPMRGPGNRVYGNSPGAVMPDGGGSMYQPGMPQQSQRWTGGGGGGQMPHPSGQNRMYLPMG